jgi:hypothetical protein
LIPSPKRTALAQPLDHPENTRGATRKRGPFHCAIYIIAYRTSLASDDLHS